MCWVVQGRPAAYIYWNSDPQIPGLEEDNETVIQTNLTFTTISTVSLSSYTGLVSFQGGTRQS